MLNQNCVGLRTSLYCLIAIVLGSCYSSSIAAELYWYDSDKGHFQSANRYSTEKSAKSV